MSIANLTSFFAGRGMETTSGLKKDRRDQYLPQDLSGSRKGHGGGLAQDASGGSNARNGAYRVTLSAAALAKLQMAEAA
ncbi:MAG: hypothetical protein HQL82_16450 [Magnetococcales bacterium]|nr:hypothetical protein [Magnetococcales bacterium]